MRNNIDCLTSVRTRSELHKCVCRWMYLAYLLLHKLRQTSGKCHKAIFPFSQESRKQYHCCIQKTATEKHQFGNNYVTRIDMLTVIYCYKHRENTRNWLFHEGNVLINACHMKLLVSNLTFVSFVTLLWQQSNHTLICLVS